MNINVHVFNVVWRIKNGNTKNHCVFVRGGDGEMLYNIYYLTRLLI